MTYVGHGYGFGSQVERSSESLSNRLEQVLRLLNLKHQCWYILNLILVGCSQLHLYPHLFISIWLTFLSNRLERVHRRVLFSIPLERGRLLPVNEDVREIILYFPTIWNGSIIFFPTVWNECIARSCLPSLWKAISQKRIHWDPTPPCQKCAKKMCEITISYNSAIFEYVMHAT